jgi:hypothetical protein
LRSNAIESSDPNWLRFAATIPICLAADLVRRRRGCYAPTVPAHRQRSGVQEARVAGLAITLSVAALILIMVYVIGDYAHRVVVEIVSVVPTASTR